MHGNLAPWHSCLFPFPVPLPVVIIHSFFHVNIESELTGYYSSLSSSYAVPTYPLFHIYLHHMSTVVRV